MTTKNVAANDTTSTIDLGNGESIDRELAVQLLRNVGANSVHDMLSRAIQDIEVARLAVKAGEDTSPEDAIEFALCRAHERLGVVAEILARRDFGVTASSGEGSVQS